MSVFSIPNRVISHQLESVSSVSVLLSRDDAARLLVAQDWETIVQELRTAIAEAVDALRPITAEEVTARDILRPLDEDRDET
jgi:hypothetical protein